RDQIAIKTESITKHFHHQHAQNGNHRRLQDTDCNCQQEQMPAAAVLAFRLGSRDERGDRIIQTEHAKLADDISRRPGYRKSSERRRAEHSRDEKSENATKIRRDHRDRVQESALLELAAGLVRWESDATRH